MNLYSALICIFFTSAVLAGHSSIQGPQVFKRESGDPSPVAGATLVAPKSSLSSIVGWFRVPEITGDLQTTSSAILGVVLDGIDGCPRVFSGVQVIVDGGQVYYNAVYRSSASADYIVYDKSGVGAGDLVTMTISASENRKTASAGFRDGSESVQATINLGSLCSSHASWVVEKLPDLPLTKYGTVNVTATVNGVDGWSFNAQDTTAFSSSGTATASLFNNVVSITAN